jgi:hypothetical protein
MVCPWSEHASVVEKVITEGRQKERHRFGAFSALLVSGFSAIIPF